MDGKSDVRSILHLMEWYEGLREDYNREMAAKIDELAEKVGLRRSPSESNSSVISRVRKIADSGFPPEEPETEVSGVKRKTVAE
jgi:hypothetical protein